MSHGTRRFHVRPRPAIASSQLFTTLVSVASEASVGADTRALVHEVWFVRGDGVPIEWFSTSGTDSRPRLMLSSSASSAFFFARRRKTLHRLRPHPLLPAFSRTVTRRPHLPKSHTMATQAAVMSAKPTQVRVVPPARSPATRFRRDLSCRKAFATPSKDSGGIGRGRSRDASNRSGFVRFALHHVTRVTQTSLPNVSGNQARVATGHEVSEGNFG